MLHYAIVIAFGMLVGAGEVMARLRDEPYRALRTRGGIFYVLMNAAASALALVLLRAFEIDLGLDAETDAARLAWTQVFAAGFGAMALFRSSFFIRRVGDQDVGIGPVAVLQTMLDTFDSTADRERAADRAASIAAIMKDVDFDKASITLPTYCMALMQNFSPQDQSDLASRLTSLRAATAISDQAKARILGLILLDYIGEDVLKQAVSSLGDEIRAA